eukprot:9725877-Alexandrium_andersonii.AAC.1
MQESLEAKRAESGSRCLHVSPPRGRGNWRVILCRCAVCGILSPPRCSARAPDWAGPRAEA